MGKKKLPFIEELKKAFKADPTCKIDIHSDGSVCTRTNELDRLRTQLDQAREALNRIAKPNQQPLKDAMRTNDFAKMLAAALKLVNTARDEAETALAAMGEG